jgi:arylsulfatase A-like enzyme
MMINLPEVDIFGHAAGTNATVMQPLVSNVDKQIGRLVAAYQRAGILSQTYFIVTADHGMTPAVHTINDSAIKSTIKSAGGQGLYVGHGDYCQVWLRNPESIPRVAAALAKANLPNVDAVFMRDPRGKYVMVSSATHLADPTVENAYSDLLSTFNEGEAPDIVLLYDENTITMTPTFAQTGRKGDHGGATWAAQHIPLVITGPGIRQGFRSSYPARIVDIAPTVETLLLVQPYHQDGVPLADAMIDPPSWAGSGQLTRGPRLSADVQALQTEAALRPNLR